MACSFGCLSLFINGLVFWFAGWLAGNLGLGFRVAGFWAGFFGALVSSVVATLLEVDLPGRPRPHPAGGGPGRPSSRSTEPSVRQGEDHLLVAEPVLGQESSPWRWSCPR